MARKILGIIVGYAVFVISSLALFRISGQAPHATAAINFMILTVIYGTLFSIISGFVAQFIAKTKDLKLNFILSSIIAGFAIFSFFKATGSHWTQILAIFIFAPASILGGLLYHRKNR
ncbi:MAG: hypothetical protein K9I84_09910 [Leadbetterella sp.]|nr:hypothetical protein [Leadbetterella sp.]